MAHYGIRRQVLLAPRISQQTPQTRNRFRRDCRLGRQQQRSVQTCCNESQAASIQTSQSLTHSLVTEKKADASDLVWYYPLLSPNDFRPRRPRKKWLWKRHLSNRARAMKTWSMRQRRELSNESLRESRSQSRTSSLAHPIGRVGNVGSIFIDFRIETWCCCWIGKGL